MLVVVILLAVNLLNYMDRFTVAGVLGRLQDYFHMDDKQAGMLQTVFVIFYMCLAPICGYFGDRYNRKFIIIVGMAIWITAVALSTLVGRDHFNVFLLLRGIVGIGEATYATVAPTIIGDMFSGSMRSTALMVFYFAVPVGSGLGFIGGSAISLWSGSWQWGVRFTPLLGMIFFVFIIVVLEEPRRGQSEYAEVEHSTIWEDLKYLMSVKTYVLTTLGFTFVVFCVGAASWWIPQMMTFAYGILHHLDDVPKDEVAHISVIFGVITCSAGIVGIVAGTSLSQAWKEGKWCLRVSPTADPFVCAAGSFVATPLFFFTLLIASHSLNFAWALMFVAVTSMCLNWALNMDILMRVIVPNRRASATAIQTLMGHLFGDASSPYIVGFISDAIRGDESSSAAKYFSLQGAMFLPNVVLVLSIACYLWSTLHILYDEHQAEMDMHG
uniref:MFS domain-containing protein n=1 Tax=Angiostrongylus cantonensis TaxID=6313 RepID=A0A0K0DPU9_ANGCA